jgi:hypothetical protein
VIVTGVAWMAVGYGLNDDRYRTLRASCPLHAEKVSFSSRGRSVALPMRYFEGPESRAASSRCDGTLVVVSVIYGLRSTTVFAASMSGVSKWLRQ